MTAALEEGCRWQTLRSFRELRSERTSCRQHGQFMLCRYGTQILRLYGLHFYSAQAPLSRSIEGVAAAECPRAHTPHQRPWETFWKPCVWVSQIHRFIVHKWILVFWHCSVHNRPQVLL